MYLVLNILFQIEGKAKGRDFVILLAEERRTVQSTLEHGNDLHQGREVIQLSKPARLSPLMQIISMLYCDLNC